MWERISDETLPGEDPVPVAVVPGQETAPEPQKPRKTRKTRKSEPANEPPERRGPMVSIWQIVAGGVGVVLFAGVIVFGVQWSASDHRRRSRTLRRLRPATWP